MVHTGYDGAEGEPVAVVVVVVGLYAVECRADKRFIGYVGLHRATFAASFTPCVEIGWRLAYDAWGCGYATEAAAAVLRDAYQRLQLSKVYSFTAEPNHRSERVMLRLGMSRLDDFLHRISVRDTDKSAKTPYAMIDVNYIIAYFKLLQLFQRQGNLTASRLIAPQVVFMETVKNLMIREKTDLELMVRKTGMKRPVYRFKNNARTLLLEYGLQTVGLFHRIS